MVDETVPAQKPVKAGAAKGGAAKAGAAKRPGAKAGAKPGAAKGAKPAKPAAKAAPTPGPTPGPTQTPAAPVKLAVVPNTPAEGMTPAPDASLVVKKKDFIERVVAASGAKKPVARDLTEAVLSVLGAALAAGESLALPPLGKLRVTRQIDKQGGEVLLVKIRRAEGAEAGPKTGPGQAAAKGPKPGRGKNAEDPLAEDED